MKAYHIAYVNLFYSENRNENTIHKVEAESEFQALQILWRTLTKTEPKGTDVSSMLDEFFDCDCLVSCPVELK